ncbi:hypothetical protein [Bacillus benzoevorans]|uniref:Uncharacterized protein n=1 Tax=Bacillus benzoevorans TaxID=1456 RepID=A0A7X0HUZ8_9BACI|nr:hypothetical protein [Bacillus benzoevorans]MBB6447375.1 hypothetical protein [Bacillus benzoevorans]
MIEGKGLGGKRVCPTKLSLTNRMDSNLKRLATSCGMPKATLAALIIERCMSDPLYVSQLQKEFNVNPSYLVMPVTRNGEVELVVRRTVQ